MTFHYTLQWINRAENRSGYYSMRDSHAAVTRLGYEIVRVARFVSQVDVYADTREELIEKRTALTRALKTWYPRCGIRFEEAK